MLFEMLVLFIVVVIICFFLSLFLLEDYPVIAIPVIMFGMIFSVLVTYGFWNVEWFFTDYNSTFGNVSGQIYSTNQYGDPYSWVFFIIFWFFVVLFLWTAKNVIRESLKTKGEMDYGDKKRRF